jgi:hypothetical protein
MKKLTVLFMILMLHGCASNKETLYEWGHYEDLIYQRYSNPGKLPPEEHIAKLEADREVARSKNKALPPGYNAQLGVLYFEIGKPDFAEKSFAAESELFPESKPFMNRLMDRIKKRGAL